MDQDPIAALKKLYRTRILREYLTAYEGLPYEKFIKSMLLLIICSFCSTFTVCVSRNKYELDDQYAS